MIDYTELFDEIESLNIEVFSSALYTKGVKNIDISIYDMSEDIIENGDDGVALFVEIPAGALNWVNAEITIGEIICNGEISMDVYLGEEWRDMDMLLERKKKYNASDATAYWRICDADKKDSLITLSSRFNSNKSEEILHQIKMRLEYLLTDEFASAITPMQPYIKSAYNA